MGFDICIYVNIIQLHKEQKCVSTSRGDNQESLEMCCLNVRIAPLLTHCDPLKECGVFGVHRTLVSEE